jgi:hypothetical protein
VTKLLFAAALVSAVAGPALAQERSFTHEGVTYTYTSTRLGDARVLEGKVARGDRFRFVVRDGWVHGRVGTTPVSFRAPKGSALPLVVAQR